MMDDEARGRGAPPARRTSRGRGVVDRLFRHESGRAVASLIRVAGRLRLAEEAVQEAFVVALERWPRDGVPDNPARGSPRRARNGDRSPAPRAALGAPSSGELERSSAAAARRDGPGRRRTRASAIRRRPAAADLHLLPPGAGARGAGRADAAHARRPARPPRSRAPSSSPRRRWRSGWCAPSARSATPASRTRCRRPSALPERLDAVLAVLYLIFNEGYAATARRRAGPRASCAPRRSGWRASCAALMPRRAGGARRCWR